MAHSKALSVGQACAKRAGVRIPRVRKASMKASPAAKSLYQRIFEDEFPFKLIIKNPITRALSIVVFLAIFGPFTYFATQLEPQTSAENFLPESHPFQRFVTAQSKFIAAQDDATVEMQIVYGFDPSNPLVPGGGRLFDPGDFGSPRHSGSFKLDSEAQRALLQHAKNN